MSLSCGCEEEDEGRSSWGRLFEEADDLSVQSHIFPNKYNCLWSTSKLKSKKGKAPVAGCTRDILWTHGPWRRLYPVWWNHQELKVKENRRGAIKWPIKRDCTAEFGWWTLRPRGSQISELEECGWMFSWALTGSEGQLSTWCFLVPTWLRIDLTMWLRCFLTTQGPKNALTAECFLFRSHLWTNILFFPPDRRWKCLKMCAHMPDSLWVAWKGCNHKVLSLNCE